jgi:hypothetical protein
MSGVEWLVIMVGIAAISWVNWYFLFAERGEKSRGRDNDDATSHD